MEECILIHFTYFSNHLGVLYGSAGLLFVGLYFIIIQILIRRKSNFSTPTSGETPELPAGFSPAAVCYLKHRGFNSNVLAVALLDMAVRGYLRIHEENGIYSLTRGDAGLAVLTPDEREIASWLDFVRIPSLILGSGNRWLFKKALTALEKYLKAAFQPRFFTTNTRYYLPGLALGLAAVIGAGYYGDIQKTAMFLLYSAWEVIWGFAFYILMKQSVASWKTAQGASGFRFSGWSRFLISLIFGIGIILIEIFSLSSWLTITNPMIIGIVGATVLLCILIRKWLKVYTPTGREAMVRIAGLRKSLSEEGTGLSDIGSAKELTPEVFGRYLPYAMALDVSEFFGRRFDSISGSTDANFKLQWYTGPKQLNGHNVSVFISSFGQSFFGVIAFMLLTSSREK